MCGSNCFSILVILCACLFLCGFDYVETDKKIFKFSNQPMVTSECSEKTKLFSIEWFGSHSCSHHLNSGSMSMRQL